MAQYYSINIHDLLDLESSAYIGEDTLRKILSDFICSLNYDVEHFLIHNAIDFTKKSQSVTYLVLEADTGALAGYYTLALKPITVSAEHLSKNAKKRIERVSSLDYDSNTYTISAYLIAQLGKNFSLPKELQIPGKELLALAYEQIALGKHDFGGVLAFLECEDKEVLLKFYTENGHTLFNQRTASKTSIAEEYLLHQLMKFV